MHDFLPRRDTELLAWVQNFNSQISVSAAAYGLTQAQADAYDLLTQAYAEAYQRAMDPTTRTTPNVLGKRDSRRAVEAESRELARLINATPGISDSQRALLGLTVRRKPSPIPAPETRPCLNIISSIGRTVTFRIRDSESPSQRGKPAGVKGAMIYSFVGSEYPSELSKWDFQGLATRPKQQIEFSHDLPAGTQVWIFAAWINPRLQAGPKSMPVSTNLQGGGVNMSAMKIAA